MFRLRKAKLRMFPVLVVCAHYSPCENSKSLNLGWNKTCVCTADEGPVLCVQMCGAGGGVWRSEQTMGGCSCLWIEVQAEEQTWQNDLDITDSCYTKLLTLSRNCLSKAINHDSFVHHESSAGGFGRCRSRWVYYHFLCLFFFFFF